MTHDAAFWHDFAAWSERLRDEAARVSKRKPVRPVTTRDKQSSQPPAKVRP